MKWHGDQPEIFSTSKNIHNAIKFSKNIFPLFLHVIAIFKTVNPQTEKDQRPLRVAQTLEWVAFVRKQKTDGEKSSLKQKLFILFLYIYIEME